MFGANDAGGLAPFVAGFDCDTDACLLNGRHGLRLAEAQIEGSLDDLWEEVTARTRQQTRIEGLVRPLAGIDLESDQDKREEPPSAFSSQIPSEEREAPNLRCLESPQ